MTHFRHSDTCMVSHTKSQYPYCRYLYPTSTKSTVQRTNIIIMSKYMSEHVVIKLLVGNVKYYY